MWQYEKKLQYPVKIKNCNAKLAQVIASQYGGPDGELGASLRYLSQRFAMPYPELKGLLTDIGTEELAHLEMVGAIIYQLTRDLSIDEIKSFFGGDEKTWKKVLKDVDKNGDGDVDYKEFKQMMIGFDPNEIVGEATMGKKGRTKFK